MKAILIISSLFLMQACSRERNREATEAETHLIGQTYRQVIAAVRDTSHTDSTDGLINLPYSLEMSEDGFDSLVNRSAGQPEVLLKIVDEIIADLTEQQEKRAAAQSDSLENVEKRSPVSELDTVSTPRKKRLPPKASAQ